MSTTNERAMARGARESIEYMSEGRSPRPRSLVGWALVSAVFYILLLGMIGSAIYLGAKAAAL